MNRLLQRLRSMEPARGSFWSLLLVGLLLMGLTGCYTQLAATERVYYEEAEEAYERPPDRVIVERYAADSTVVKEYYYNRSPYYYRRYFARFYGDPFFYDDCFDPFYYDPFYCDPFYYGPSIRFRLSFYFGDPFFYWPPVYHGHYWFYGFGYYYYSPYYWAYYPGYYPYAFVIPHRGRVAWNYAPRGASLGRSAWIGRSPRALGRSGYERVEARTRSIVRTTRSTAVAPRHSSTGVVRHATQEATQTRARTVTRARRGAERSRTTTGRSTVTRSGGQTRSTMTRRTTRQTKGERSIIRPENRRPAVTPRTRSQGTSPRTQRAPATRSGDRPARSTTRTRPRGGNNDDRQEVRYRPETVRTYQAPSVRTSTPGHSRTVIRTMPPPLTPRPVPRIRSAPASDAAPAVRAPGRQVSAERRTPSRHPHRQIRSRRGH